jgi:hypothetical protein
LGFAGLVEEAAGLLSEKRDVKSYREKCKNPRGFISRIVHSFLVIVCRVPRSLIIYDKEGGRACVFKHGVKSVNFIKFCRC